MCVYVCTIYFGICGTNLSNYLGFTRHDIGLIFRSGKNHSSCWVKIISNKINVHKIFFMSLNFLCKKFLQNLKFLQSYLFTTLKNVYPRLSSFKYCTKYDRKKNKFIFNDSTIKFYIHLKSIDSF